MGIRRIPHGRRRDAGKTLHGSDKRLGMSKVKEFIKTRQDVLGLILVLAPILIYWIYWTLNPSYWFNADPAAIYFIDSMAVFIGKTYQYVDHPGTPMQVIGSLLLAVTYPFFEGRDAFIQFFISRPGVFFLMTHVFLLAANLFCAVLFYKTVASSLTQNRVLAASAISILSFTLHPNSFQSLTFWSHNSLNYPIGTLLLVWLYRELRNSQEIKPSKLVLMGLASGAFAIAQLYFFAWIVSAVFTVMVFSLHLHKSYKRALSSGMFMALGGLLGVTSMLLPIYEELPRFFTWMMGLVTHLGLYGSGDEGIYSFSLIALSLGFWWDTIRLMMIVLLISLGVLVIFAYWLKRTNTKIPAGDSAMVIGLLFHTGLVLLLMTKAALKLRYSLSLAAVLPVLVFMVIKLLETTTWKTKYTLNIFYVLALIGIATSLVGQKDIVDKRARIEGEAQAAKSEVVNRLAREMGVTEDEIVVIHTFAVPLKCSGLLHATNWTGTFQDELSAICPNQFAVWDSFVELNMAIPPKDFDDINWDIVIWPGNGSNLPEYLYSIGAVNLPRSWHMPLSSWFFIHSEWAKE